MATANIRDGVVSDQFDYEIWAPITKSTLIEQGLWDVVVNGVPQDPSKNPELAATIQPEELSKWRDFVVKDAKALQILQSSLTDSVFRKTLSASSAKDVWDLLRKGNEQATIRRLEQVTIRRLEKQLEDLKMVDKESGSSYLDKALEILERLGRAKLEKSDYEICKNVFTTLSGSFDGLDSMLEELIDVHKMTSKSLVEYFYYRVHESSTEEAIFGLLKDLRLKSKSEKWCGLCYKNNHNQEDCKFRIHTDKEEKEDEIVVDYRLETVPNLGAKTYDDDIWIIHKMAPINMTPYVKYFTTLDRTFKATVGTVDGTVLLVEGKGDVKIRMKEGKKKTIRNVIFVPGLNRNVLSFGKMVSKRYSISTGMQGECIVCDRGENKLGDATWMTDETEMALRLKVIEGKLTY